MIEHSDHNALVEEETERLYAKLSHLGWSRGICKAIAPMTLEINRLKAETDTVILGHSYQTPDILFGVSDFMGDSYGLSVEAAKTKASRILFAGVVFMAETAKILSPDKVVLVPRADAGCTLADGLTGADVRALKEKHPGKPAICYVNTTADVKAECDACVTSANAVKVITSFPDKEIIFLPDRHMADNLEEVTGKTFIKWHAICIVHEEFKLKDILLLRERHEGLCVLAHPECPIEVAQEADMVGGTSDMIRYVKDSDAPFFFLATERGLIERLRVECPDKKFVGVCEFCPFMKMNTLYNIREALKNPKPENIVEVEGSIRVRALRSLERMFELSTSNT